MKGLVRDYLSERGVSERTKGTYERQLRQFGRWLNRKGVQAQEVTESQLRSYQSHLRESGLADSTVSGYVGAVRRFVRWLFGKMDERAFALDPVSVSAKSSKRPLSKAEAKALLDHTHPDNAGTLRNYAMINLMLHTGLRCIEVQRADVGDIYRNGRGVMVLAVQGKGRQEKDEEIGLMPHVIAPLKRYLETRGELEDNAPLFASESNRNQGGRLRADSISRVILNALRGIGIDDPHVTAHSLRHTAAQRAMESDGYAAANRKLRHKKYEGTASYLR